MHLIFYLVKINDIELLKKYGMFLMGVIKTNKNPAIILCESNNDLNDLNDIFTSVDNVRIINIYASKNNDLCTDRINAVKTNLEINKEDNYLFNIESKYKNKLDMHNNLFVLNKLLYDLINRYDIKACIVFSNQTFRSVGLIIFQRIINKLEIPFYYLTRTPIKDGRYMIYDSIYYESNEFNLKYNNILYNGLNSMEKKCIDKFIKNYFDFKINIHIPYFEYILKSESNNNIMFFNVFSIKKLIKRYNRFIIKKKYSNLLHNNDSKLKPYILLLLTKKNHWFTSFANPELLDRKNYIEQVLKAIPKGYNLVLKPHPRSIYDDDLIDVLENNDNCFIEIDKNVNEVVKNSKLVIYTGTTSGVEALLHFKHVIEIGKYSIIFNFSNPPVKRSESLSDLKPLISQCLNQNPPRNEIYAFLFNLLNNSFAINDDISKIKNYNHMYSDMKIYNKLSDYMLSRLNDDNVFLN